MAESKNQLENYFLDVPSGQSILDIFPNDWISTVPASTGLITRSGRIPLFEDGRIQWGIAQAGGVSGMNVLELGPLEGGHTYMMLNAGASSVMSIEANARAYLRCLCIKEALRLDRARFLLGDFSSFLEQTDDHYELILAVGVLYHMTDPVRMIELLAEHTDRAIIWTHYFDDDSLRKVNIRDRYAKSSELIAGKYGNYEAYRHNYGEALTLNSYCGGMKEYSAWLTRESLLELLRDVGFDKIVLEGEQPDHPHGPCLSIYAERTR